MRASSCTWSTHSTERKTRGCLPGSPTNRAPGDTTPPWCCDSPTSASSDITLNVLWQHNWSDGSGLVSPFFEVSPVPLTTIQLGPVFVYGDDGSETMNNRLVPGGKRLELLLLVKVSDSYTQ